MKRKLSFLTSIPAHPKNAWISRLIADELVVLPLRSPADGASFRLLYAFSNPTAIFLWNIIDGRNTVGEIILAFKERFAGRPETIEAKISESINDLLTAGLVVLARKRKASPERRNLRVVTPRRKFVDPEIAAIRMSPEQAVLSCCQETSAAKTGGADTNYCNMPGLCVLGPCGSGTVTYAAAGAYASS